MNKTTTFLAALVGAGIGIGGMQLITVNDAAALPASVHTFCIRQDPPYGVNDPNYDPDAGLRYVVEAYGNILTDAGVADLGGAPSFEISPAIVEEIRREVYAGWRAGKQLPEESP